MCGALVTIGLTFIAPEVILYPFQSKGGVIGCLDG